MTEDRRPGAVVYVGARRGPAGRGGFQVWRYRATGRVLEVPEANAYAPSDELEPGAAGFVAYERGVPVVVRRPGARPSRPPASPRARPAEPPPPRPARRPRLLGLPPALWGLIVLLAIAIAIAWGR